MKNRGRKEDKVVIELKHKYKFRAFSGRQGKKL